jgi:hypothetical protein
MPDAGILIGHSHVVIEKIDSLASTTPADTTKFAFFKGLNDADKNGVLSTEVTGGLAAGFYKMSSINSAANHQPALVGVAQHGSIDDAGQSIASLVLPEPSTDRSLPLSLSLLYRHCEWPGKQRRQQRRQQRR